MASGPSAKDRAFSCENSRKPSQSGMDTRVYRVNLLPCRC